MTNAEEEVAAEPAPPPKAGFLAGVTRFGGNRVSPSKQPLLAGSPQQAQTGIMASTSHAAANLSTQAGSFVRDAGTKAVDSVGDVVGDMTEMGKELGARGAADLKDGAEDAMAEGKKQFVIFANLGMMLLDKMSLFTKLIVFLLVNGALMLYLFVLARFILRYMGGTSEMKSDGTSLYTVSLGLSEDTLTLIVHDYYLPVQPDLTPEIVGNLTYLVSIDSDGPGDPGWNLQDIMNVSRAHDLADEYFDADGKRFIQDYRYCTKSCLAVDGRPKDLASSYRNYSATPYGWQLGDYYVDSDLFLRNLDPDFYAAYLNPDTIKLQYMYSNWGQTSESMDLTTTAPTDAKHVCNLGTPRRKMLGINIHTAACHVQIAPYEGSEYRIFFRGYQGMLPPIVKEEEQKFPETGCNQYLLNIQVSSPSCPVSLVPGTIPSCDMSCALILFVGQYARKVPILVFADMDPGVDQSHFVIDDKFLTLDTRHPWMTLSPSPDLHLGGGAMKVHLSNARIQRLTTNISHGRVLSSFLRVDLAEFYTHDDNIVVEDSRDTVLRYRSPGNFICAAAPLVEVVPSDFIACDMLPPAQPANQVYQFYEITVDNVIDTNEFLIGMDRLGLDFGKDSLGLDPEESQRLLNHVFSYPDVESEELTLPLDGFVARLHMVAPPMVTLYDVQEYKLPCVSNCTAMGKLAWECSKECAWSCNGGDLGVAEPIYGECNLETGCERACGQPDWPIQRYSTVANELSVEQSLDPPYEINGDGLMDEHEVRMLLLHMFGNCTYLVERSVGVYCSLAGRNSFRSAEPQFVKDCSYTSGNPTDWRTNNTGLPSDASAAAYYGGHEPRECRPFPDYDPRLSNRVYDPSASKHDCPECFLLSGDRVPSHYYNRSTWDTDDYNTAMGYMLQLLQPHFSGRYIPYFNISDDAQYKVFASYLLAPMLVSARVSYFTFGINLQTLEGLDFLGPKRLLFNPYCYNARFLKIRPTYSEVGDNEAAIKSESIEYSDDSYGLVDDTRMPGFKKSNNPEHAEIILPCPPAWGSGAAGSTNFSYFDWAVYPTLGYKWGAALPLFCFDEHWPDGGVWNGSHGLYPDTAIYKHLAGRPILPGCVPDACLAIYTSENHQASVHAQILPYKFDPRNATGAYQTMVSNCDDGDGVSRCFYKGYGDAYDVWMTPNDQAAYTDAMQGCVDGDPDCSDQVFILQVTGEGVPSHMLWFWTSRLVYMQVEPAYFWIMSIGLLIPTANKLTLRMSPGFCEKTSGAVEETDWRNVDTYGKDTQTERSLRSTRNAAVFQALRTNFMPPPTGSGVLSSNSGFYIKQVNRLPYTNESLYYSPTTVDGVADTSSGYLDTSGQIVGTGPAWRHNRVCYATNCAVDYIIHKDNCFVERYAIEVPHTNGSMVWNLSDCVFQNGSSAYRNPDLGDFSMSFNSTAYEDQFADNKTIYAWYGRVDTMTGDEVLIRNLETYLFGYGSDNITLYEFTKFKVQYTDQQDVEFVDASANANANIALLMCIIFSLVIAVTCGVAAMGLLIFFGLKYVSKLKKVMEVEKKAAAARLKTRQKDLFQRILLIKTGKIYKTRARALTAKAKAEMDLKKKLSLVVAAAADMDVAKAMEVEAEELEKQERSENKELRPPIGFELDPSYRPEYYTPSRPGLALSAPEPESKAEGDANIDDCEPDIDCDDVCLTDEEKLEILWVMANQDYTPDRASQWNLSQMVKIWLGECHARRENIKLSGLSNEHFYTLLPSNRDPPPLHLQVKLSLPLVFDLKAQSGLTEQNPGVAKKKNPMWGVISNTFEKNGQVGPEPGVKPSSVRDMLSFMPKKSGTAGSELSMADLHRAPNPTMTQASGGLHSGGEAREPASLGSPPVTIGSADSHTLMLPHDQMESDQQMEALIVSDLPESTEGSATMKVPLLIDLPSSAAAEGEKSTPKMRLKLPISPKPGSPGSRIGVSPPPIVNKSMVIPNAGVFIKDAVTVAGGPGRTVKQPSNLSRPSSVSEHGVQYKPPDLGDVQSMSVSGPRAEADVATLVSPKAIEGSASITNSAGELHGELNIPGGISDRLSDAYLTTSITATTMAIEAQLSIQRASSAKLPRPPRESQAGVGGGPLGEGAEDGFSRAASQATRFKGLAATPREIQAGPIVEGTHTPADGETSHVGPTPMSSAAVPWDVGGGDATPRSAGGSTPGGSTVATSAAACGGDTKPSDAAADKSNAADNSQDTSDAAAAAAVAADNDSVAKEDGEKSAESKEGKEKNGKEKEQTKEQIEAEKEKQLMLTGTAVQRIAHANMKSFKRAFRGAKRVLYFLPSPFKLVDLVIIAQVKLMIINSLQIFLNVKCCADHQMRANETIVLGQVDFKTEEKLVKESRKFSRSRLTAREKAEADGKDDDKTGTADMSDVLEIDGVDNEGIVATMGHTKWELYASKFVRIMVHEVPIPGTPGEREEDKALVVVIQEGAGAILSDLYEREKDEKDCCCECCDGDNYVSTTWDNRTLILPCPLIPNPDGSKAEGILRVYYISEVHGPSYIAINTMGAKPVIEFKSSRRAFNAIYERWCISNGLKFREMLDEQKFLMDLGITMTKRIYTMVKGLKQKRSNLSTALLSDDTRADVDEAINAILAARRDAACAAMSVPLITFPEDQSPAGHQTSPFAEAGPFPPIAEDGALPDGVSGTLRMKSGAPLLIDGDSVGQSMNTSVVVSRAGSISGSGLAPGVSSLLETGSGALSMAAKLIKPSKKKNSEVQKMLDKQMKDKDLKRPAPSNHEEGEDGQDEEKDKVATAAAADAAAAAAEDPKGKLKHLKEDTQASKDAEKAAKAAALAEEEENDKRRLLFDGLMRSTEPLAMFLKSEAELTANFANDSWAIGLMTQNYRNWIRIQAMKDRLAMLQEEDAAIVRAKEEYAQLILDTSAAAVAAQANAVAMDRLAAEAHDAVQQVRLNSFDIPSTPSGQELPISDGLLDVFVGGSPGGSPRLSPLELASRVAAAAAAQAHIEAEAATTTAVALALSGPPPPPPVAPTACMDYVTNGLVDDLIITPPDVEAFGLKYLEEDGYTMFGLVVNIKDLQDSPKDSNILIWLLIDIVNVIVHAVFIWALSAPLMFVCIQYQTVYGSTTAVEHLLTLSNFRQDPRLFNELYFEPFLRNLLFLAIGWVIFGYIKLTIYYLFYADKWQTQGWRVIIRAVFWIYLMVMIALLVAYLFEIMCWLILGAVINPNKYLPFSVATITLVAHTGATYARVMKMMKMYEEKVRFIVQHVFETKLKAALEFAQKAAKSAQKALEEATSKVEGAVATAQAAVQGVVNNASDAMGGIAGAVPIPPPNAPTPPAAPAPPPGPAYQPLPTSDAAPVAMPFPGAHGAALAGAPGAHMQHMQGPPGMQMQYMQGPPGGYGYPMPPQALGYGYGAAMGGGYMPIPGGMQPSGVPLMTAAQPMGLGFGLGGIGPSAHTVVVQHPPGGAPPPVAGAAAPAGAAGATDESGEPVPLNPFTIYKLYAKGDDGLGYVDFCQLLDHLEIKLVGDKRRELFAKYTSKARKKMAYKEFEACYKKIQQGLVMQTLIDAGITKARMIMIVCYAVFLLILIFIFIFVGVAAFTGAGTVGAVINSLLAAGSGIALNLKGGDEAKKESSEAVIVTVGDEKFMQAPDGTLTALNADGTAA